MNRCPHCNQRIRPPRTHILNRNTISYLSKIFRAIKQSENKFIETDEMYQIRFKGSNTAENSKLKYLGALKPFYTGDEEERGVKRSGKWTLTEKGVMFLIGHGTLPEYVTVVDEKIIDWGKQVFINDPSLKWYKHQDYWNDVVNDVETGGLVMPKTLKEYLK